MRKLDFRLYLITDRKLVSPVTSLRSAVEEALRGGVRAIQLREKDLPTRELLKTAYEMREVTAKYGAKLFINDRVDIALCVEADGVHLGRSSMPVYAVRSIVGERCLIGASTHSLEEALEAEREGADFINFGPLFETASKLTYGQPLGLEALKSVRKQVALPVFGIGGVKLHDTGEVLRSGADGIALISGIFGEEDVRGASENYLRALSLPGK